MSPYRKSELAIIKADQAYWNELALALGWQLRGFTDRKRASFITSKISNRWEIIEILPAQRDDILLAIRNNQGMANDDSLSLLGL